MDVEPPAEMPPALANEHCDLTSACSTDRGAALGSPNCCLRVGRRMKHSSPQRTGWPAPWLHSLHTVAPGLAQTLPPCSCVLWMAACLCVTSGWWRSVPCSLAAAWTGAEGSLHIPWSLISLQKSSDLPVHTRAWGSLWGGLRPPRAAKVFALGVGCPQQVSHPSPQGPGGQPGSGGGSPGHPFPRTP